MNYSFFPTCKNRTATLKELCKKYACLSYETVGESLCGRPIDAVTIGCKTDGVLLCGAIHGMEWLTTLVLLRFIDECCASLETGDCLCGFKLNRFLSRRGVTFIPCANPDGVEIQLRGSLTAGKYHNKINCITKNTSRWQANARGVDLNHNFDAGWDDVKRLEIEAGITCPAPTRYGGERPFSEPETQCLAQFCKQNDFRQMLVFHSQGREIYYDFGPRTPMRGYELVKLFARASGYEVSHPEGIAVGGGFKDWFIQEFGKPGFTIEIGLGTNPLPIRMLDEEYEKLRELLCFSVVA